MLPSCGEVAVVMGPIFSPSAAVMGFFQRNVLFDMECWHVRGSLMVAPQVFRDFFESEISAEPPTVCGLRAIEQMRSRRWRRRGLARVTAVSVGRRIAPAAK